MIELQSKLFETNLSSVDSEPIPAFTIPNLSQFEIVIIATNPTASNDFSLGLARIIYRDSKGRKYLGEELFLSDSPLAISIPPLADTFDLEVFPGVNTSNLSLEIWKTKDVQIQKLDTIINKVSEVTANTASLNSAVNNQGFALASFYGDTGENLMAIRDLIALGNTTETELKDTLAKDTTAVGMVSQLTGLTAKLNNVKDELTKLTTGTTKSATEETLALVKATINSINSALTSTNTILTSTKDTINTNSSLTNSKLDTLTSYAFDGNSVAVSSSNKLDTIASNTAALLNPLSVRASETTLSTLNGKIPALSASSRVKVENLRADFTEATATIAASGNASGWVTLANSAVGLALPIASAIVFYFELSTDGTNSIGELTTADGTTRLTVTGGTITKVVSGEFLKHLYPYKGAKIRVRSTTNVVSALNFRFFFCN